MTKENDAYDPHEQQLPHRREGGLKDAGFFRGLVDSARDRELEDKTFYELEHGQTDDSPETPAERP